MTLDDALEEWRSKQRKMGCVAASNWLCRRVEGFAPVRMELFTDRGEVYEHVVASDGKVHIDLAPYAAAPKGGYPGKTIVVTRIQHQMLPPITPWRGVAYRLENSEGQGPYSGDQACVDYLMPHYDPQDLFTLQDYPQEALQALSAAGFFFGWKTKKLYKAFFKPKGQRACEKLGFRLNEYRPTAALCLPDGQVLFDKQMSREDGHGELLSQLLKALSGKA